MSTLIGCIIILFCVYILTDLDDFILDMQTERVNLFNAIGLIVTLLWFIYEFFHESGPISLIPIGLGLFIKTYRITLFGTRLIHILVFSVVILTVAFIIINKSYWHFNFWTFTF